MEGRPGRTPADELGRNERNAPQSVGLRGVVFVAQVMLVTGTFPMLRA
jgi:hypothetical protein